MHIYDHASVGPGSPPTQRPSFLSFPCMLFLSLPSKPSLARSRSRSAHALLSQVLQASNERNRLQEKQAELLQQELERLRTELHAARRQQQVDVSAASGAGVVPREDHDAIVKDLKDALATVKVQRDAALVRARPLHNIQVHAMRLLEQVNALSAFTADVFENAVLQTNYLELMHDDHTHIEARMKQIQQENDVLQQAMKTLQSDNDAKTARTDTDGPSPRSMRLLHEEMQLTAAGHVVLQQKVDELIRMLTDANSAREAGELKYQNVMTSKINAELERDAAQRQLAAALSQVRVTLVGICRIFCKEPYIRKEPYIF